MVPCTPPRSAPPKCPNGALPAAPLRFVLRVKREFGLATEKKQGKKGKNQCDALAICATAVVHFRASLKAPGPPCPPRLALSLSALKRSAPSRPVLPRYATSNCAAVAVGYGASHLCAAAPPLYRTRTTLNRFAPRRPFLSCPTPPRHAERRRPLLSFFAAQLLNPLHAEKQV